MIQGVNPAEPFPNPAKLEANLYPQSSRYFGLKILKLQRPDGREVAYLERRFLPDTEEFEELRVHTVAEGERLDLIANEYFGDPSQFWRVCDANSIMNPEDLEEIGRQVKITLPQGFSGGGFSGGDRA